MNIKKGIFNYYLHSVERTEFPLGDKVIYTGKGGYESEHENLPFKVGDILTVNEIYVGTYSSTVEFIEFPGKRFNTVMFKDVEI